MPADDPLAWPAATSVWRWLAESGTGGSLRAGLGLLATERLRPAGGTTRGGSSRMDGIGYIPRSVAASTVAAAVTGSKLRPAISAALEDAEVLRCHERCGYGLAPTPWPGEAGAFGVVAAARSVACHRLHRLAGVAVASVGYLDGHPSQAAGEEGCPMAKEFRVSHAEIWQEGLGRHGTSDYFRSALQTSWVAGTQVTRYSRTWRLSRSRQEDGFWLGHIGFVKEGELETLAWDDSEKDFIRGAASSGIVVPFIIDDVNRVISFQLIPGAVNRKTVTSNLEALLNEEGTYRWRIEPISYSMDFDAWEQSVARVSRINARLTYPNPDWTGRDNLESIMDGFNAEVVRLIAAAQEDSSLDTGSDWFQQTMDHARHGYGRAEVSGTDRTTGTESKYFLTDRGGVVPAISRVAANDEAENEVSIEELREAHLRITALEPAERPAVSPDEDNDDDRRS